MRDFLGEFSNEARLGGVAWTCTAVGLGVGALGFGCDIEGADRYRNPDEDLPADFEARRDEHYAALGLPRDADAFIARVRTEMIGALATFDSGLAANPYARILKRSGGRTALTPLDKQKTPPASLPSRPRSAGAGQ